MVPGGGYEDGTVQRLNRQRRTLQTPRAPRANYDFRLSLWHNSNQHSVG